MPYIIETFDKPGAGALRAATRPAHLAFLAANAAKLLVCGAKLDDAGVAAQGGMYVVDLDSRAEAEAFIAADPFSEAELFERVVITRMRKAYVDGKSYLG
jgi:uncharacterized protein YciI